MWYLVFIALFFALPIHAQGLSPYFNEPLSISVTPDYPAPGQPARATVTSPNVDFTDADISWSVDGEPVQDGGIEFDFVMGRAGVATRIAVFVEIGGESLTFERSIVPASVDLVWEATSYTPSLFRGKPLPSPGTSVRVEALPDLRRGTTRIAQNQLIYTWYKNGAVQTSASGRGRSSAVFPAPILFGSETIAVEVVSPDRTTGATGSVRVATIDPVISLYENHPIFGLRTNRALRVSAMPDIEVTVTALPYYAPDVPQSTALEYAWTVNGSSITPDPNFPNSLTLNAQDSSGSARLILSLGHTSNIFLSARSEWLLTLQSGPDIRDPFFTPPGL